MPKFVSYQARFQFVRLACFELVLRGGIPALSRQSVADEIGAAAATLRRLITPEASLAGFAADEVDSCRRRVLFRSSSQRTPGDMLSTVRLLVPRDEDLATEVVALRLTHHAWAPPSRTERDDEVLTIAEQYQVADRGYVHRTAIPREMPTDPRMVERVAEWDSGQQAVVDGACEALGFGGDRLAAASRELRALVDGLVVARCAGRVSWDQANAHLDEWVARVGHAGPERPPRH